MRVQKIREGRCGESHAVKTKSPICQPVRKSLDVGPLRLNRTTWNQHFDEVLHEHADARVVVLVAGDFSEHFGARSRECVPGTGIYRTPCEPHFGSYSRDGGLYVSVNIPTEACGRPDLCGFRNDSAYDVRNPALALLGARLAAEVMFPDQWSPLAVYGLILEVLAQMGRCNEAQSLCKPRWIDDLCTLLREDRRSTWSLTELATFAGVHPAYLGRAFRKHVGIGVGDFQRALRVERARRLLESTTRSVADIAATTGFCDQSHLNRSFRRVLGVTPDRYRRAVLPATDASKGSNPS